ncbi:hypothetical protein [Halorubrum sp. GN12_10-3_MGM]|uniref:hypothetical protein n=1 Tax=Halorubrum sp. GN12_10-3_MGM TaxID=2518113 RepID=UPI0010F79423|nr:hypothetical protein [Halorubrum sp. GN12_10-3_MGM]TKX64341.1 hypothetical protein EXE47_11510 [Halorubrum sp. GN12_10-3_MGM]
MDDSKTDKEMTVQEYVFTLVEQAPSDVTKDSNAREELIEQASAEYIVYANKENIQDHEYHFLSLVRVKGLLNDAQEIYENQTDDLFELAEQDDNEEYKRELAESAGRYSVGNTYLALYSLAYETMDDLVELLVPKIVPEDLDDSVSNILVDEVDRYDKRANLLYQAEIISEDTKEGIERMGNIRNKLVHDVDERFFVTFLDDTDGFDHITDTLNELYQQVYDKPIYVTDNEPIL